MSALQDREPNAQPTSNPDTAMATTGNELETNTEQTGQHKQVLDQKNG